MYAARQTQWGEKEAFVAILFLPARLFKRKTK